MGDVFTVAATLVAHAVASRPGEVALVAYYGSHAKGTATATSDLDLFYIPVDGTDPPLSAAFVLDGLPYDFWPVRWEMAEAIADARSSRPWAVSASLIADAVVLYSRSPEDEVRFGALQERIEGLTGPEERVSMIERARAGFPAVLAHVGRVRAARDAGDAAGAQWAGRRVFESAVNCLALINQRYFSRGWGANLDEILALPVQPPGFAEAIDSLLLPTDMEGLLGAAESLAAGVRDTLREARATAAGPANPAGIFAGFYPYVFEYVAKVRAACDRGDRIAAGYAAAMLQELTSALMHEAVSGSFPGDIDLFGEYAGEYRRAELPDLMAAAAAGDLAALAGGVGELDARIRVWLAERAIPLGVLTDAAELDRFLG